MKYGTGADLLVHEVAIARPELMSEAYVQRIMAHHTTAREAGMVFQRARPKLAAYTHLVFLANERVSPASAADLITETRQSYSGPLVVGEDLMSFEIGKTVHVRRDRHPGTGWLLQRAQRCNELLLRLLALGRQPSPEGQPSRLSEVQPKQRDTSVGTLRRPKV